MWARILLSILMLCVTSLPAMAGPWLKQSTAVTLRVGPFVDSADGNTEENGLTISQADVQLSKNAGAFAQKSETTACTATTLGWYTCPLNTTDTNTLGILLVAVHETGALSVFQEFMVVPANVWDSLFGADALQVHVTEITNSLITASSIATDAFTAAKFAADVTTELQSGAAVLLSGTLQASTTTTAVFPSSWNIGDEAIKDALIWLTGGTGAPAFRYCTKYTNSTDTCQISPPWPVAPDATTTFSVWPAGSTGISLVCRVSDATPAAGEMDAAATCDPAMSSSDDAYNNMFFVPQEGTFAGVPRCVSDYTGATRTFHFTGATDAPDEPFPSALANGTSFKLIGRCQR